jgi:multiple sugar transport system ATP-binding protein
MNHGAIEQFGEPQEIYDRPSSMFVADFVGSPPMNFLELRAALQTGDCELPMNGARVPVPQIHEQLEESELVLGVRPEHIKLDDQSPIRGQIYGSEYLGTTQILTLDTAHGQIKARTPANRIVQIGENVGLSFLTERLSLFEKSGGRAIKTALHAGGANHG